MATGLYITGSDCKLFNVAVAGGSTNSISANCDRLDVVNLYANNYYNNHSGRSADEIDAAGTDWNVVNSRFKAGLKNLGVGNGQWSNCHFTGTSQNVVLSAPQVFTGCVFDSGTSSLVEHSTGGQCSFSGCNFYQNSGTTTATAISITHTTGESVTLVGCHLSGGTGDQFATFIDAPIASTTIIGVEIEPGALASTTVSGTSVPTLWGSGAPGFSLGIEFSGRAWGLASPFVPTGVETSNYQANSWDLVLVGAQLIVTLPTNPQPGDQVGVLRDGTTGTITVQVGSGTAQTINLQSSSVSLNATGTAGEYQGLLILVAMTAGVNGSGQSTAQWIITSSVGTDAGLGWSYDGPVELRGDSTLEILAKTRTSTYTSSDGSSPLNNCDASSGSINIVLNYVSANAVSIFKRVDSTTGNQVTLTAGSGFTLEGSSSAYIVGPGDAVIVALDGSDYKLLSMYASSYPPNGAASGDLSGSYPDPTVSGIQGGSSRGDGYTQALSWG